MATVGIIGIGDMGSGIANNLMKNGFDVKGFDLNEQRLAAFENSGGIACKTVAEVGQSSDAVFVMVMNGDQFNEVVFGKGGTKGLADTMAKGTVIALTATIKPKEAVAVWDRLKQTGIEMIDSPVSGGRPGADGGTLTLMAAGSAAAMEKARAPMEAISGTIHNVGEEIGRGQTVKACLQSLIGSIFSGTYEATALAAKAGVPGQVIYDVFSTSAAGCGIVNGSIQNIMDRKFEDTGSHINTMHKDLTISLDFAMDLGVPLFTASTAMQMFQAGRARFPDGDNQSVAKVSEEIIGAGLKR